MPIRKIKVRTYQVATCPTGCVPRRKLCELHSSNSTNETKRRSNCNKLERSRRSSKEVTHESI